jgi:hypothetical protein
MLPDPSGTGDQVHGIPGPRVGQRQSLGLGEPTIALYDGFGHTKNRLIKHVIPYICFVNPCHTEG